MKEQEHTTLLRAVIVDDEQLAHTIISEHLLSHPDVKVIATCTNGFDAVKIINEQKPELVFLDIQMPKLTGFEVLELLETTPSVIFVTAFDQHAIKAFEVHAIDYLLKPFSQERFDDALQRVRHHHAKSDTSSFDQLLTDVRSHHQPLERILIKEGNSIRILPVDSIEYIEAQDDYVGVKSGTKIYLKQQRMAELETLLDPATFIRIHRSYILHVGRLAKLESSSNYNRIAILKDGTQLPVSRTGYEKLKKLL